ncbi:FtsB family cell division protein [Thalassobacillus hwangdonensis]|uniref:Septum formation initiator family protein n=1 Tax=Thalassobacillus hwangdonensis TaxID=546108 RepID=A0ABW3L561_9BACI
MADKRVTRLDSTYMQQYDVHQARQRRKKKRLFRRLALFALVITIVSAWMINYHFDQKALYAEKQEKLEALEEEKLSLENQEKTLNEEIQLLNNEEYVLQIARTNYFFSKEGEIIFKLPDDDPSY